MIRELVRTADEVGDIDSRSVLNWFLSEQIEEEALARTLIDKLNLIGNDKGGLYLFDRDLEGMSGPEGGNAK